MVDNNSPSGRLSPWWRNSVIIVLVIGFSVLIWMAVRAHRDAPPIPEKAVGPSGETIFSREEILSGQEVFLRYGLMENGTIWGHGAYLGPDFSATYLHTLVTDTQEARARQQYQKSYADLTLTDRTAVDVFVQTVLKQNHYDSYTETLQYRQFEAVSYDKHI